MNINIKATNTTLTPSIQDSIDEKLAKLDAFLRPEHKIRVELEVDKKHKSGLLYRVEVDIQPTGFYAEARGSDFHEALDLCIPKIKEQILKEKDKKISLRRQRK